LSSLSSSSLPFPAFALASWFLRSSIWALYSANCPRNSTSPSNPPTAILSAWTALAGIFFALLANCKVDKVSALNFGPSQIVARRTIYPPPLRNGCNNLVSLESRYGICEVDEAFGVASPGAEVLGFVRREMTVPRVRSDLFMYAPSLRRTSCVEAFSLPARSIKLCYQLWKKNHNTNVDVLIRWDRSFDSMVICMTAWDREDTLLNSVAAVIRAESPRRRRSCMSSGFDNLHSVIGNTFTRP